METSLRLKALFGLVIHSIQKRKMGIKKCALHSSTAELNAYRHAHNGWQLDIHTVKDKLKSE